MKSVKSWSVEEMLAEGPCEEYDEERVRALWDQRERLTLLQILDLEIPTEHKLWVACRPSALTRKQCAAWLDLVVARAVKEHVLKCGVPTVEAWGRDWLSGKDRAESAARSAAESAAWSAASAAWSAARSAAWSAASAARSAAESAARSAAESAARSAAESAAWSAAWSAARSAERSQQVSDIRKVLR